jgi:pilus assembly protein Flp/PilA
MQLLSRFILEEEGADAVEYALVIALIALVIVAGATFMGSSIRDKLNGLGGNVTNCTTGSASC